MISERPFTHSEVLLQAHVIGGLPMIDDGEADDDDKVISILHGDPVFDDYREEFGEL